MYESLQKYSRVSSGGYASIKDVSTMTQEDHQQSFFLAETCKVRTARPRCRRSLTKCGSCLHRRTSNRVSRIRRGRAS
jgi:hypothetical protein